MKTDHSKSPPEFYTIKEIADCVDASTRTVRRWIEKKLLVAHRINGLIRVSEADFRTFLAAHSSVSWCSLSSQLFELF
jgi:excisionase family DNA binding protein